MIPYSSFSSINGRIAADLPSVLASRERETRPDPTRIAPATNPEVPAVILAALFDARYRKLTPMPNAPAIIEMLASTLQRIRRALDSIGNILRSRHWPSRQTREFSDWPEAPRSYPLLRRSGGSRSARPTLQIDPSYKSLHFTTHPATGRHPVFLGVAQVRRSVSVTLGVRSWQSSPLGGRGVRPRRGFPARSEPCGR